jgi:hypothetical protein
MGSENLLRLPDNIEAGEESHGVGRLEVMAAGRCTVILHVLRHGYQSILWLARGGVNRKVVPHL